MADLADTSKALSVQDELARCLNMAAVAVGDLRTIGLIPEPLTVNHAPLPAAVPGINSLLVDLHTAIEEIGVLSHGLSSRIGRL
mgnify:CR=1 FL=1